MLSHHCMEIDGKDFSYVRAHDIYDPTPETA